MLNSTSIGKVKAAYKRMDILAGGAFAGEYRCALKGRGLEFEVMRQYQPGDDVRIIDWNATARTGEPFVREFREERNLNVLLAVDCSASNDFGTGGRLKSDVIRDLAALIALAGTKNGDNVELALFSDTVERYLPPGTGRVQAWRIVHELMTWSPRSRGTSVSAPLEHLTRIRDRNTVCFLISDFLDQGYEQKLMAANRRHRLICMFITDPREEEIPSAGLVMFHDAESGEGRLVDTGARGFRKRFCVEREKLHRKRVDMFRTAGMDMMELRTDRPFLEPLIRFLRSMSPQARRGRL